jgi:phage tail-like protein
LAIKFIERNNPLDRRNRLGDFLLSCHFHIFDVSFSIPTVFLPVYGFASVTSPSINVETKDIKEGTFEYKRSIPMGASAEDITFEQGARFFNSDFYDWIDGVIRGETNLRRNLLLVQYSQIAVSDLPSGGAGRQNLGFSPITDLVSRVPARAWLLIDTIPINYKAATDFQAIGSEVSLMSLTVRPFFVEEFNTGI